MKRSTYTFTALLLALTLLVGCAANAESKTASDTESIVASETISKEASNEVYSSEIEELTEAESSTDGKFKDIASFTTEFNKENVHYYDGRMIYVDIMLARTSLYFRYSHTGKFEAYNNAADDDWFVVGLWCDDELREIINHIGAIEITDHPFLYDKSFEEKVNAAKTQSEKDLLLKEQYESRFPGADYEKDPNPYAEFGYIGYFTKPMIEELSEVVDGTGFPITFMPEIGNNECWFEKLRLS